MNPVNKGASRNEEAPVLAMNEDRGFSLGRPEQLLTTQPYGVPDGA